MDVWSGSRNTSDVSSNPLNAPASSSQESLVWFTIQRAWVLLTIGKKEVS